MKLKLGLLLTSIILSGLLFGVVQKNNDLKEEIAVKENNIKQLESDNYLLTFKKGELEDYVKDLNTEFKRNIDSVTMEHNIRIKDIQKLINTKSVITLLDTVYLPGETVYIKEDNKYHYNFSMDSACFKMSGTVISNDPEPLVKLNSLSAEHETYSIYHREKKKWWQIFKRRKIIMETFDNCGHSTTKILEIR